jgi:hypothetical protein
MFHAEFYYILGFFLDTDCFVEIATETLLISNLTLGGKAAIRWRRRFSNRSHCLFRHWCFLTKLDDSLRRRVPKFKTVANEFSRPVTLHGFEHDQESSSGLGRQMLPKYRILPTFFIIKSSCKHTTISYLSRFYHKLNFLRI